MAKVRHEYALGLPGPASIPTQPIPPQMALRNPDPADTEMLAQLMFDSYQGTIDYDGESVADARIEVASYFTRTDAPPCWTSLPWPCSMGGS